MLTQKIMAVIILSPVILYVVVRNTLRHFPVYRIFD
jgi:hypothetical protein